MKRGDLVQIQHTIGIRMEKQTITGILLSYTPVEPNMYDNIGDIEILTDQGNTLGLSLFHGDQITVLNAQNPDPKCK